MGLRSMKKVIKSFWVTAEERNIDLVLKMTGKIMFQQKFTVSDFCIAMTYQITSRRHLPSSSSMTTIRYRNNSISSMYSLHKSTTSHITNICFHITAFPLATQIKMFKPHIHHICQKPHGCHCQIFHIVNF